SSRNIGARASREAGGESHVRPNPPRRPTLAVTLGTVDDAECGRAREAAGVTDRDHELAHAQRWRVPDYRAYHRAARLELEGGEVALQVARHDPPARTRAVAELDCR